MVEQIIMSCHSFPSVADPSQAICMTLTLLVSRLVLKIFFPLEPRALRVLKTWTVNKQIMEIKLQ